MIWKAGMRLAGRNPRRLAWQRRWRAVKYWLRAISSFLLPFGIESLITKLLDLEPEDSIPDLWLLCLYSPFWLFGLMSLGQGWRYWKWAGLASQGVVGEAEVAQTLEPLAPEGWQLEYDVPIRAGGDVDILCTSPQGRLLTLDVKSHNCTVVSHGDHLYRQYGRQRYPFETDLLAQALQQAGQVQRLRQADSVTPLIVFSRAQVRVEAEKLRGVYVTERDRLLDLLRRLG